MSNAHIVSVSPASSGLFREELKRTPQAEFVERLDEWRSLCRFPSTSSHLFALHRFPVQFEQCLPDLDLETVSSSLVERFSCCRLGDHPYGIQLCANLRMPWVFPDLVEEIRSRAQLPQTTFCPRDPESVLSIYLHRVDSRGRVFAGISPVKENLSPWSSGQCRIPRVPDSVSRAEAKLLEGREAFGLPTRVEGGLALDLGAAPGGWSRVLLDWGYEVHAVDPAPLEPAVASRVRVFSETAGRFLGRPGPRYDLLVCDMKMEAKKVAELLLKFAPRLAPGGRVFATLKLGRKNTALDEALQALEILKGRFQVEAARQLFFNRSEVSVLLLNPS